MKKLLLFLSLIFTTASFADTETINWYKEGRAYAQTTCETGNDVILPTMPTKRGYNFTGWVPAYDFSTFDYTIRPADYNSFDSTNRTFKLVFSYGVVFGKSLCAIVSDGETPDETLGGRYCWCKATGFSLPNSDVVYESIQNLPWLYRNNYDTENSCSVYCTYSCAYNFFLDSGLRKRAFGIQ